MRWTCEKGGTKVKQMRKLKGKKVFVYTIYFTMIIVIHIRFQILERKKCVMLKLLYFTVICCVITGFLVSNLDSNSYVAFSRYSFLLPFGWVVLITWFWLMHLKMHIKTNENPLKRQITFDNLFMLYLCMSKVNFLLSCHMPIVIVRNEKKTLQILGQTKGCSNPHNFAIADN